MRCLDPNSFQTPRSRGTLGPLNNQDTSYRTVLTAYRILSQ